MAQTLIDKAILNVEEAADFLGFSAYTIREKARTGEVPARKIGREWRFSREVLQEWMRSGSAPKRSSVVIVLNENLDGTFSAHLQDDPSIEGFGETADIAVTDVASKLQRSQWNPKYRYELPADPGENI